MYATAIISTASEALASPHTTPARQWNFPQPMSSISSSSVTPPSLLLCALVARPGSIATVPYGV
jgi:hypothetical protein